MTWGWLVKAGRWLAPWVKRAAPIIGDAAKDFIVKKLAPKEPPDA